MYKSCPKCGRSWETRDEMLDDPDVELAGFQPNTIHPERGFFLFTHFSNNRTCKSTFGVLVTDFLDLHDGPIEDMNAFGTIGCTGLCLVAGNLNLCETPCKNSSLREIIQIILDRQKKKTGE